MQRAKTFRELEKLFSDMSAFCGPRTQKEFAARVTELDQEALENSDEY